MRCRKTILSAYRLEITMDDWWREGVQISDTTRDIEDLENPKVKTRVSATRLGHTSLSLSAV